MAKVFCEICGKELTSIQIYRGQTVCSHSCATKRQFRNPENRKKISLSVKKAFENPEVKQRHKEAMVDWASRVCTTEEYRKNMSERLTEVYKNPELRKNIGLAVSKALLSPEVNKRLRDAINKAYENPEVHLKLSIATKEALNRPEVKAKQKSGVRKAFEERKEEMLQKANATKKKNHSFNSSKSEQHIKEVLQRVFPDVIYQYRSKEYPFNCDFYIPSLDLYIEFNYHWTHGGRPFDETDKDCIERLTMLKEKAKTSQFYQNAIDTWTMRDVKKRQCAIDNDLNWLCFYNIDEFNNWLNSNKGE